MATFISPAERVPEYLIDAVVNYDYIRDTNMCIVSRQAMEDAYTFLSGLRRVEDATPMTYSELDILDYDREQIPKFVSAIYPIFLLKGWTYFHTHPNVPSEFDLADTVSHCINVAILHMNTTQTDAVTVGTGRIYVRVSTVGGNKLALTLTLDPV